MSDYIYETKNVKAGKKIKWCSACKKEIKIGKPSITITTFRGEYVQEPVCNSKCEKKFREEFPNNEE